jgi:hypothetical protein
MPQCTPTQHNNKTKNRKVKKKVYYVHAISQENRGKNLGISKTILMEM